MTYQKLLEKTEVSKHTDNDKYGNLLPNPEKICINFQLYYQPKDEIEQN